MIPAGVVTALAAEAQTLLGNTATPGAVTRFGEHFIILSGMGAERAAAGARKLVDRGAKGLVSWGTAGALAPHLRAGTMLLPRAASRPDGRRYTVDTLWRTRLHDRLQKQLTVDTGLLAMHAQICTSAAEKAELHARTGAVAVDMESAAIGEVASAAGVPLLIVRSIADTSALTVPAFIARVTDPYGRARLRSLTGALLREPTASLQLFALRRMWKTALQSLRIAAHSAGPDLAAKG